MANPHRPVQGAAQQRRATPRNHGAGFGRCTPRDHVGTGRVGIKQTTRLAPECIKHAREAIGSGNLAQHCGCVIALPIDTALGLRHERQPSSKAMVFHRTSRRRLQAARHMALQRPQHGHYGRLRDLAPVHAGFGGTGTHHKRLAGPDLARIEIAHCLQHGDTPVRITAHEHPVQCARPPIARHARVHHEAHGVRPDRLRDAPLEEWRQHHIGPEQSHGILGDRIGNVEFHRHLVPLRTQQAKEPLAQAVETVGEQEDAHNNQIPMRGP